MKMNKVHDIYKSVTSFSESAYFEALRKFKLIGDREFPEIPANVRDLIHEFSKEMSKLIKAYCRACGYDPDAEGDDEDDYAK